MDAWEAAQQVHSKAGEKEQPAMTWHRLLQVGVSPFLL